MTEQKLLTADELADCLDAIKGGYDCTAGLLESHIAALQQQADAGAEALRVVTDAATAFVEKMKRIESSNEYKSAWICAAIHGQPYRGESWESEFKALEHAVAAKGVEHD